MQQQQYMLQQGQIEGNFLCAIEGERFEYLVTYEGGRSVDWHATIRRGRIFSWSSGTISHNTRSGAQLEEAVRVQVLASIGAMRAC